MKEFLDKSRQFVNTVASKVNKAINPPLTSDATPLDLQHAILEAIESRTQPLGAGRRALPDRYVKVKIVAKDAADERAMQLVLSGMRDRIAGRLRELQCDVPAEFAVDIAYLRRRPASWSADQPMAIDFEADVPAGSTAAIAAAPVEATQPALVLTVVRGRASAPSYSLREPSIRVGRSAAPVDDRGHARHNHVVFAEDDDAHNRTVGRGHCEIRFNRAGGEYRIFDERSANGTRIIRDGHVIEVPPKDPFGIAIRTGDVLEFGTASARVEIVP